MTEHRNEIDLDLIRTARYMAGRNRRQRELAKITTSYFACGACEYICTDDYGIAVINEVTEACPTCGADARVGKFHYKNGQVFLD